MIITCQECESSFNIGDNLVKETGSKVKCSKCGNVFVVYPEALTDEPEYETAISGLEQESGELQFAEEAEADSEDLGLPDLDSMFEDEEDLASDELSEDASDGLELDLAEDFEQEDHSYGLEKSAGTDLPDLEGLMDFDEASETEDESDLMADELEMDFDLAEDDADAGEFDEEFEETAESDLSDLDTIFDLDEDSEPAEKTEMAAEELDLEFDLDTEYADTAEVEHTDELDLSDLEDLIDSDAMPESTKATETPAEEPDRVLDLDAESAEPTVAAEHTDELDLSDLEDIIESDQTPAIEAVTAETAQEPEPDMQLDFEVDEDSQTPAAAAVAEAADEIVFSEQGEIFDENEEPVSDALTDESPQKLDLEIDLETESAEPIVETEQDEELDLSDLKEMLDSEAVTESVEETETVADELELQLDSDAESVEPTIETEQVEELDLSDLDQKVDSIATPEPVEETEAAVEELDLDFEAALDSETAAPQQIVADTQPAADEEEFLDLEKMLEESEASALGVEEVTDIEELGLDLDSELQEQEVLDISESVEDDLEFNLLEPDEVALQEDGAERESSDFQPASTATDGMGGTADDFDMEEFTDTRDMHGETEVIDDLAVETFKPAKKRGIGRALKLFSIFLILVAAVLILPQNLGLKIPYLSDIKIPYISDIKIPYISDKFKPQPQDLAGNLKITPLSASINYQFFDNSKTGTLFVIKGRIKNEYDHPRSFIRVTGKIYQKGNVLAKTATVYSGNLLSAKELTDLDMAVINKRLQNKFGYRKSNLKVKTGSVVPFMIVFDKLPNNLDEYTVEVAGSS